MTAKPSARAPVVSRVQVVPVAQEAVPPAQTILETTQAPAAILRALITGAAVTIQTPVTVAAALSLELAAVAIPVTLPVETQAGQGERVPALAPVAPTSSVLRGSRGEAR